LGTPVDWRDTLICKLDARADTRIPTEPPTPQTALISPLENRAASVKMRA